MKREWAAGPAMIKQGKDGGKERNQVARKPSFLRRIVGIPLRLLVGLDPR
jgi:hypothetical protein